MDEARNYYSLIQTAFKRLAPYYDMVAAPIAGLRKQIVDLAGAKPGSKILDVATGTGAQALAFGEAGYPAIGVDLSEAMLNVARRKNQFAHVQFESGDSTNLRFTDNSFDVSTISFALHDMPRSIREKTLREMIRVTRPQGTIMIVDYGLPRNKLGAFLIYHLIRLYESEYYAEFIRSDFTALALSAGIEMLWERRLWLGGIHVLKGVKR
jgi:demethylmenaquinone methyltransferase / 2-methoxy-6-polyprenyl-1,4-benzoquinol methylase